MVKKGLNQARIRVSKIRREKSGQRESINSDPVYVEADLNRQVGSALDKAFMTAHFKFPADPWPSLVNPAHHVASIQRRAPAIFQPRHGSAAPLVNRDKIIGHAGVGKQHDLQAATAGLAVCAGRPGIRQGGGLDVHQRFLVFDMCIHS